MQVLRNESYRKVVVLDLYTAASLQQTCGCRDLTPGYFRATG